MPDIHTIISRLAAEESRRSAFLAPCIQGSEVRARIDGIVHTFAVEPASFAGWGIFAPADASRARLIEEAGIEWIDRYLRLFPRMRMILARNLRGGSWLAYPANESDMRQRFGAARPVVVHLANGGSRFEQIVTRYDGSAWWFDRIDRRAAPILADRLREAYRDSLPPEDLRIAGMTPEMRAAYEMALRGDADDMRRGEELRLQRALAPGGARLERCRDGDDVWNIEWRTRDGELHGSAVYKRDLTVVGAGICLSGRDREFDLQSLVRVVEERPEWMRG